jgi:hypothetical protein
MLRLILACVVAMLLVTASPAFADTRQQILRECQDGALTGDYTAKQIRDARDNIPTDIDQYSDCRQVLSSALLGLAGGSGPSNGSGGSGGGSGGSGGSGGGGTGGGGGSSGGSGGSTAGGLLTPTTPQDQQALADAAAGAGPVDVGGTSVDAAKVGLGGIRHTLPTSMIVALALLALAAAAAAVPFARRVRGLDPRKLVTLGRRVVARGR